MTSPCQIGRRNTFVEPHLSGRLTLRRTSSERQSDECQRANEVISGLLRETDGGMETAHCYRNLVSMLIAAQLQCPL